MGQLTEALHAIPEVTSHTRQRFYQPELDGLRFYAFLGVFVCHSLPFEGTFYRRFHLPMPWLWGAIAKSGAAGVDLFFALSAFLITSILLRERAETGGISLRRFYLRRVLRIWPLYFLLIGLGARSLWTAGVGLLPAVDGLDRGTVLPGMAATHEDAPAARHDHRRHCDFPAGDRKPGRLYADRLERGVHLLRQHIAL